MDNRSITSEQESLENSMYRKSSAPISSHVRQIATASRRFKWWKWSLGGDTFRAQIGSVVLSPDIRQGPLKCECGKITRITADRCHPGAREGSSCFRHAEQVCNHQHSEGGEYG